jgi:hypothetical protein
MKKAFFILAILVMAFGNMSFASRKANLKADVTANVLKHYGVRNETSMVPEIASWRTTDNVKYRTVYTYDEYEYYLDEEYTKIDEGNGWKDYYMISYQYDFSGNVIEALAKLANETGAMENEARATYTYDIDMLSEVIYQYWDGGWVNEKKEVYNYNGDVITVLFWDWNGTNWTSDELFTYTYGNGTIELIIQYMEGGAWQNEEKIIYTLDFDENVTEIVDAEWTGTIWENALRLVYNYEDGVYVSMVQQDWIDGAWNDEPSYKCDYVYENGNATHGECHFMDTYSADYELEMAYGYNADVKTFFGCEVDVTYVDITSVNENTQANFKVYPVPAENEIQIQAEGFQKAEIYNVAGQKLMESTREKMNVSSLSQGVYLLKVYDQSGKAETQRIVVK